MELQELYSLMRIALKKGAAVNEVILVINDRMLIPGLTVRYRTDLCDFEQLFVILYINLLIISLLVYV